MRKINILILLLCTIFALVSLSSCDPNLMGLVDGDTNEEHVHNYGYLEYTQDAEGNITKSGTCACGETLVEAATYEEVFCFNDSKLSVAWIDENTHIYLKGAWVIHDTIGETEVTAIDDNAFKNLMNITSLTLPETVTSIGDSAFYNCSALTTINIPEGVNSIGSQAFSMCSELTNMGLDEDNSTFKLVDRALYDYEMTTLLAYPTAEGDIEIPSGVVTIGPYAFDSCSSMSSVTIPETVTTIEDSAFIDCTGLRDTVTIPSSVTTIADGAFFATYITSMTIPDTVTHVGNGAFERCRYLGSIVIGSGVSSIPANLFKDCYKLTSVTIPPSITSISESAFEDCRSLNKSIELTLNYEGTLEQWNSITKENGWNNSLPDNYTLVCTDETITHSFTDDWTYRQVGEEVQKVRLCSECGEAKIIESSVDEVFDVFVNRSIKALYVADGITLSGAWTLPTTVDGQNVNRLQQEGFKGQTQLTAVTIPATLRNINIGTFQGCTGLVTVTLPSTLSTIPSNAFEQCTSLTTINTAETQLRTVGMYAFRGCTSLTSIVIPDIKYRDENRTTIGVEAFKNCTNLTSITMPSVNRIDKQAFYGCRKLTSVDLSNVEKLGDGAFYACGLTSVDLSSASDASDIGKNVFVGCNITEVTFSDQLTSIPQGIFQSCDFTSFTIPEHITSIGRAAFFSCKNLESVTIHSSVNSIGESAFAKSSKLTSLSIPASVTSIGSDAFSRCSSLTSITVDPNNPNYSAEGGAFYSKDKKTLFSYPSATGEVKINSNVETIESEAFDSCSNMTKITIPASVKKIGIKAFMGCYNLSTIVFEGTTSQWRSISKGNYWNDIAPASEVKCSNGYVYL